jgi:hypothetical protein
MMWCELAFQNWNQMLILLRGKGRPKFHISKESLGCFIVMLTFLLIMVGEFECSGPRSTLYISMWPACLKGWSPCLKVRSWLPKLLMTNYWALDKWQGNYFETSIHLFYEEYIIDSSLVLFEKYPLRISLVLAAVLIQALRGSVNLCRRQHLKSGYCRLNSDSYFCFIIISPSQ